MRPRLKIIFEDHDLLVVNKPPGLLTSTNPRERRPTLLAMVREYVGEREPRARVGLIHRLDRDASGLLIFSKSHRAYVSLKQQFFKHSVERVYLALVDGKPNPPAGTIDTKLIERADGTVYSSHVHGKGERAISHYETVWTVGKRSLVRVRLETGKKHQIRVHLSERGVPIVNDPMYGKQKSEGTMMLVAVKLSIEHPVTHEPLTFEVDPPTEMRKPS